MSRRVELPNPDDIEVPLFDVSVDTERTYRKRVLTRSVKKSIKACGAGIDKAYSVIKDKEEPTAKQEEALMRSLCDLLNVVLETGADDAPAGGDLLYTAWLEDRVSDEQITGLLEGLGFGLDKETESDPT